MDKLFTTCLLIQDGSSATELIKTDINLHPGSAFSPDQGNDILLAGGFPALFPDTAFPLSSTLQLNSSLARRSPEQLHKIALAELSKKNSPNFRSYTVEADSRVAVIGDDARKLLTFIESYGGVLQIEPLLLKGCHPELPTVPELGFSHEKSGVRLEYQVRSPFDMQRCVYCGNCGPACPENCIDENLYLDYSKCTLCRECEFACPVNAVDVHGVIERTVEVPAVIILGDVRLETEEGTSCFYREDSLEAYFATLFPARIDEVVTWNRALCQYSARFGYGCDLCLSSCRFGAITQNDQGVQVDGLKCEECGACFAACPTGAIQYEKISDQAFIEYLNGFPDLQNSTVIIGNDQSFHRLWWLGQKANFGGTFFMSYDQPQGLSLFHFLTLVSRGVQKIVVVDLEQHAVSARQIALANDLLSRLFEVTEVVSYASPEELSGGSDERSGTRSLPLLKNELDVSAVFNNRRRSLANSLSQLTSASGKTVTMQPAGYVPFATVSCSTDKCTQCMACLNDCKIGALSADTGQLTLNRTGALCVGCGICLNICPENALSISSTFTLDDDFFKPVQLAKAEPMACKGCGKIFGTRKSYERVMAILAQKESVDASHFEYCDDCRVIRLFEEQ